MLENVLLTEALRYIDLGWKVFPVNKNKRPLTEKGFKDATTKPHIIRRWWRRYPLAGIAIATGRESNLVVLDIDLKQKSPENVLSKLVKQQGEFKQNTVAYSGGGGIHFYFIHPGVKKIQSVTNIFGMEGVDIRADGGYIIAPPSKHASGKCYAWDDGRTPFDAPLDPCPEFILELQRHQRYQFDSNAPIPQGRRNLTLTAIAGLLRSFGLQRDEILQLLQMQNEKRCIPPLTEIELETIANHIIAYPGYNTREDGAQDIADDALLNFTRTDAGLSEMFSHIFMGQVKFDHTRGHWYLWKEQFWDADVKQQIVQKVIHASKLFTRAAVSIEDEHARDAAIKYGARIQHRSRIDAALVLAKTMPTIATSHDEWDADTDIVACHSGVIDLFTGKLHQGRPDDLIAHYLPVYLDETATAPRWDRFLEEVFSSDSAVIKFVQRAVGYSLTGRTDEQVMFVLIGKGSNGKSTFLEVLHALFGNYSLAAPFSTFDRNRNSSQTNDIAALAGKRFVSSTEPNQGVVFDESRIKSLTGGDTISARFLHREFFEFQPVCKIWMGVNHLPRVRDDSDGFWRRIRRIDFPNRFWNPGEDFPAGSKMQDPELIPALKEELTGILNWALEGARLWYKDGLKVPSSVISATQTYRDDSDPLYTFFNTCCIVSDNAQAEIDRFYRAYLADCENRGLRRYEILSAARFQERLRSSFNRIDIEGRPSVEGIQLNDFGEGLLSKQVVSSIKIRRRIRT